MTEQQQSPADGRPLPVVLPGPPDDDEPDDDGCPFGDPDCMGNNGDRHDECERPADSTPDDVDEVQPWQRPRGM